jgi:4-hydroxy-3-polyprenylbenzoate decarboxylase
MMILLPIPFSKELGSPLNALALSIISDDLCGCHLDPSAKITVLLDEDVDIHNLNQVLHALGSRWQPQRSSEIIDNANALSGDPSSFEKGIGSRIIIDATRNATESQTDKPFSKMNIACLREEFPDLLETIEEKFKEII